MTESAPPEEPLLEKENQSLQQKIDELGENPCVRSESKKGTLKFQPWHSGDLGWLCQ